MFCACLLVPESKGFQRVPPYVKSTLKVTFFIKKDNSFHLFLNGILGARGKTHTRKIYKNNVETEAEAKTEAWAGRVQGGNNCSPLSDNCYEASTAWKVVRIIFTVNSTCCCLCPQKQKQRRQQKQKQKQIRQRMQKCFFCSNGLIKLARRWTGLPARKKNVVKYYILIKLGPKYIKYNKI